MTSELFLDAAQMRTLTGFVLKNRQIAQLRAMGIAFRVNGEGRPSLMVTKPMV